MTDPMANNAVAAADSAPRKLGTLEVGRGLAALAVVMHHASQASDAFTAPDHAGMFVWGLYGVDFFFVLSGFIIYHVHQNDPRRIGAAQRFLIKRLRRIYVPYLPITVVLISAYLILPGFPQGNRDWGWFTSLTLLPSDAPPALSVAWTLTFEMIFYLFFLSFFVTRYFRHLVLGWVLLVLVIAGFGLNDTLSNPLSRTLLDPLILEFVAGMAAAHYFGKLQLAHWYAPLILGGRGVLLFALLPDPHRAVLGVSIGPVVLGLALAEERFRIRTPKVLVLLGAASYAIYLIHNPLQSLVGRALQGADNWLLTFAVCCAASVTAGILYHLIYERPMLRLLSRKRRVNIETAHLDHQR